AAHPRCGGRRGPAPGVAAPHRARRLGVGGDGRAAPPGRAWGSDPTATWGPPRRDGVAALAQLRYCERLNPRLQDWINHTRSEVHLMTNVTRARRQARLSRALGLPLTPKST